MLEFLIENTVKLGDKERFDKEHLALRNNFRVTKKFLITKFNCIFIFFGRDDM